MNKAFIHTAAILALGSVSAFAQAVELKPFKAVYEADWDSGLSFSGEAVRELSRQKDGSWLLISQADASIASLKETSRFTFKDGLMQPVRYTYKRKVLGKKRTAELDFDWANAKVTNNVGKQPWQMEIPTGTLDKLGYQLQLKLDLGKQSEFSYQIADGGKLKTYNFKVIGNEQVSTPAGQYDAIKVQRDRGPNSKRQTYIWFAPSQNNLIVRIHQTEKDGKEYGLTLKKIEVN